MRITCFFKHIAVKASLVKTCYTKLPCFCLQALYLFLLSSASITQAADLMDIFRSARDRDPGWAAQQLKYQTEKQGLAAAEALLYPKIYYTASARDIHTSGSGVAMINPVYLEEGPLLGCFEDSFKGRSCNPPLVIRDDLGGRYDTFSMSLQFAQPLYNYELWRGYNKAKILDSAADANFEKAKQDLILSIAESYFAVLRAYEQWEHDQAEAASVERQLEETKKRYQLGLLPQHDVYDVRTALDASNVKLLLARTALENAQENLMLMTQRRDVSLASLSDKLVVEAPQPQNVEEWVKRGLEFNRTLSAAQASTLAAEQELAMKKGGFHPTIELVAGYSVSRNDRVAIEQAPDVRQSGIGVQMTYPLYKGGLTTAEVKAASHNYARSEQLFELARRDVIRNVRNNYRRVNSDVKAVEAAAQAIHSSEKSLEASLSGYANGSRPLISVLQAQNDLFRARKDHANARYSYIMDSLRLKHSAGILVIEDLQVVNSWLNVDKLILPPDLNSEDEVQIDLFY
jgi:outer membrane protein